MGFFMSKQAKAFNPKWEVCVQELFERAFEDVCDNYDIFLDLLREEAKEDGLTDFDFSYYRELTIGHFADPKSNFWKGFLRAFGKYVKENRL
jgi:hypothetical protein